MYFNSREVGLKTQERHDTGQIHHDNNPVLVLIHGEKHPKSWLATNIIILNITKTWGNRLENQWDSAQSDVMRAARSL